MRSALPIFARRLTRALALVAAATGAAVMANGAQTSGSEPPAIVNITTLIETDGGRVDWSRAHDRIAFSMKGADGYFGIYTMKPDGSDQVCLTCDKPEVPQLNNDQPAWHPSGDWIVFQSQDPDLKLTPRMALQAKYFTQGGVGVNNNLWLVNKEGTLFKQLTFIRNAQATLHPHFSRDGTKLLWSAIDSVNEQKIGERRWMLKVADFSLDSLELTNERWYRPLATDTTFYESHGWSVDDSEVIFSANIGRESQYDLDIWTLDLATGTPTQLTDSPLVWDEHAQISPSGERIVWLSSEGYPFPDKTYRWALRGDFWIMNMDGSNKTRLTEMGPVPADSSWNADGTKLVATVGKGPWYGTQIEVFEFNGPQ